MQFKWSLSLSIFVVFGLLSLSNSAESSSRISQGAIVSDTSHAGAQMKLISPGNQSMSLEDQLKGVQAPIAIMPDNPVAISHETQFNYPVMVGNEGQIDVLQNELKNMFIKADKNAGELTKYEQYTLFLLYKQAEQNQLVLAQNNKIILALEKISLQNEALLQKETTHKES